MLQLCVELIVGQTEKLRGESRIVQALLLDAENLSWHLETHCLWEVRACLAI